MRWIEKPQTDVELKPCPTNSTQHGSMVSLAEEATDVANAEVERLVKECKRKDKIIIKLLKVYYCIRNKDCSKCKQWVEGKGCQFSVEDALKLAKKEIKLK